MIEQVLVPIDPVAGDELLEQRLVETARRLHVDVLDDGGLAQAGELAAGVTSRLFSRSIASRSTIRARRSSKASAAMSGCRALLLERLGHAGEPERDQAIVGGMREHRSPPCLSVVVATAADVGVPDRRAVRRLLSRVGFVEPVLEDRGDRAVAGRADVVAAPAGGFEPVEP